MVGRRTVSATLECAAFTWSIEEEERKETEHHEADDERARNGHGANESGKVKQSG